MKKSTLEIVCLDFAYGKTHDFKLFRKSKLPILKNTKIITDTGYTGILKIHKNSEFPKKKIKNKRLSEEIKINNKKISKDRIYNEYVIGSVKRFRIIAEKYRNRLKRFKLRFSLIVGIYNYELNNF